MTSHRAEPLRSLVSKQELKDFVIGVFGRSLSNTATDLEVPAISDHHVGLLVGCIEIVLWEKALLQGG